ncbi:MAG: GDP-mannose 4,6-dehydratase [Patescibacteria group bacterium]
MKKQIIITGGLGFLGQHLIKRLIREGFYPIIIDDLSVGKLETLKQFPKSKFTFIKCDIIERGRLERKLVKFRPETIVHLAALHFIPNCDKNPIKTISINALGTFILLEIASKKKIKNFLFTSSAAVYKPGMYPHKEDDFLEPIDIYGISKKSAEEMIKFYCENTNLRFIILRIFNVYGPNNPNSHIIPQLLSQANKSNRIKLGRLDTFRDYIYINDAVDALMKTIKSQRGFDNSTYNVGTGKKYSGHSLVKIVSKIIKKKLSVHKDKNLIRKIDRKSLVSDATKFSKVYSWKPKYNLYNGLKELIELISIKIQK